MSFASLVMLAVLPILLVASAFFSGSETALFSLTRHQRARLTRSQTIPDQLLTTLLSETRSLLITLLLSNMTVNVLIFVISSVLLIQLGRSDQFGPIAMTVLSLAPLLTVILCGEVLPKLVAARLPLTWAKVVSLPLYVCHRVLAPVRVTASWLVITPLARLIAPPRRPPSLSPEELESLLALSQKHGVIDPHEERLLQQVLELSQLKVRDLMVPRVDVQAHDLDDPPQALIDLVRQAKLRQIPVYREDLDHVVGVVYSRQVMLRRPRTYEDVKRLVKQVNFVPEQQRADQLLVELRKTGTTFAMVVDEYGGTAGLITIEDVVEHMVGNIAGPFEAASEPRLQSLRPGLWRVGAEMPVHDWAEVFGHNPAVEGLGALESVSTLGGLVMARLGRVPEVGESTTVGNVLIRVEAAKGLRLDTLLVELQSPGGQPASPAQERAK